MAQTRCDAPSQPLGQVRQVVAWGVDIVHLAWLGTRIPFSQ